MGIFVVPVTQGLHISRAQFSVVSTITSLMGMFLSPIAGKIMAKKNIRYIMTVSIAICTLSYASFSFAQSPIHLYLSAIGIGFTFTFVANLPISILLNRWFVKSRSTVTSIAFAGANIGAMILSPLVTGMISSMGWRMSYRILGFGMFVILVPLVFFVIRSTPAEMGLEAYGTSELDSGAAHNQNHGLSLKYLRGKSVFWYFLAGLTLVVLTLGVMYHMPAHVVGLGYSEEQAAMFVSIYSAVAIAGKFLVGAVFDRYGSKAGILAAAGSLSVLFTCLLLFRSYPLVCLGGCFYGIGSASGTLLAPLLVGKIFGDKYYSEIVGFANAFTNLAMAINNPLFASAFDLTGNYTVAWIGGLAASLAGIVLLIISATKGHFLLVQATEQKQEI